MIIIDSREKPKAIGKIIEYFERNGYKYDVSKMYIGDYMDYANPRLVIDRKQNIAELAKNCTSDHERFRRELERAKETDTHIVVLVEQNLYKNHKDWIYVHDITDLMLWSSPHTVVKGEKVYRVLASWCAKYPLSVKFCDKRTTGRNITEILYNEKIGANNGK